MKRLLTDREIKTVYASVPDNYPDADRALEDGRRTSKAQDFKTLKTVGGEGAELLSKIWNKSDSGLRKSIYDFFEALKRGE